MSISNPSSLSGYKFSLIYKASSLKQGLSDSILYPLVDTISYPFQISKLSFARNLPVLLQALLAKINIDAPFGIYFFENIPISYSTSTSFLLIFVVSIIAHAAI